MVPNTLVSKVARKWSRSVFSNGRYSETPAQLTSTSIWPKRATTCSTIAAAASGFATSPATAMPSAPAAVISSMTFAAAALPLR
jgi:hypothetical protein